MSDLEHFERAIQIHLPDAMKLFFTRSQKPRYFEPPSADQVCSLGYLVPQMPHRFLPVLGTRAGDSYGIFFPRGEEAPFLATFNHEESILLPFAPSFDEFFRDPDPYSQDHPSAKSGHPRVDWSRCQPLLVDAVRSATPELELLKPMCLHYRLLEKSDESVFGKLLSRFGSTDRRARILQRAFPSVLSLLDHQKWLAVSGMLSEQGFGREAIQALENSIPLLFIDPWYGNPRKPGVEKMWTRVRGAYESLLPLLKEHGDALDRVAARHQLEIATCWAKREIA